MLLQQPRKWFSSRKTLSYKFLWERQKLIALELRTLANQRMQRELMGISHRNVVVTILWHIFLLSFWTLGVSSSCLLRAHVCRSWVYGWFVLAWSQLMLLWNVVRKQRSMAQMSTHIFSALQRSLRVTFDSAIFGRKSIWYLFRSEQPRDPSTVTKGLFLKDDFSKGNFLGLFFFEAINWCLQRHSSQAFKKR